MECSNPIDDDNKNICGRIFRQEFSKAIDDVAIIKIQKRPQEFINVDFLISPRTRAQHHKIRAPIIDIIIENTITIKIYKMVDNHSIII